MTWHLTPRSFFLVHVSYVTTTSSVVCVYNSPLNKGFNELLIVWLRVTSITYGTNVQYIDKVRSYHTFSGL